MSILCRQFVRWCKRCMKIFFDKILTICMFIIQSTDMKQTNANFDVRSFIAFWGGPSAMRNQWQEHGIILTKGMQDKWLQRNKIPSQRLVQAVAIAKSLRRPMSLDQFIITTKQ